MEIKTETTEGTVVISAKEYKTLVRQVESLNNTLNNLSKELCRSISGFATSRDTYVDSEVVLNVIEDFFPIEYAEVMTKIEAKWTAREQEKAMRAAKREAEAAE